MLVPSLDRTARDAAYLTLGMLTSVLALGVWVAALTVSLTLAIFIIGIPVVIASAYAMRWTAELDRQNAALVFGRPVRGHYRSHRGHSLGARVINTVRDPQVWRDLAWLITHSVVGFAFGVLALSFVASVVGTAVLPLWYWALPEGFQMGIYTADTLPEAIGTAF